MISKTDLGIRVRDKISGLVGTATSWHENFSGVAQVGITAPAKNGVPPEPMCFDVTQVEFAGPKERIIDFTSPPAHEFSLGDQVKDTMTGFVGRITSLSTFVNGCAYAVLQPESKKNEWPERQSIPVAQIEMIKPFKKPVVEQKRGGPMQRVMR